MDFNLSKEQELLRDGLASSCRRDTTSRRAAPQPRPARVGNPRSGAASPTNSASWAPRCPRSRRDRRRSRRDHGHRRSARARAGRGTLRRHRCGRRRPVAPRGRPGGDLTAGEHRRRHRGRRVGRGGASSGDHWQEPSTVAARDGDGWTLRGSKIVAMCAPLATHLLVTARTDNGISLFVVDLRRPVRG